MNGEGVRAVRRMLTLAALVAFPALAGAQSPLALVRELSGKVDVMPPGKAWAPAVVGQKLDKGAQIATAFRSSATLALGDSLLAVKPLTQMSIEKLVQTGNLVKTEVYLRVGKVKADVVTPQGLANDFKLKSPTATASVRGTSFEFDGETLLVERGTVVMIAASGAERPVKRGEASKVEKGGAVAAPRDEAAAAAKVQSLREAVTERAQEAGTATIEVAAAAESVQAAAEEVAAEPEPVAVLEANGTVTLVIPGQGFPAGLSGALLVVSAGPPLAIYPAGSGMVALSFGGSAPPGAYPAGSAVVLSTIAATSSPASYPAGSSAPAVGIGSLLPSSAYPAGLSAAAIDLGTPLPAATYPAGLSSQGASVGSFFNPPVFPSAPATGSLGLTVE